MSSGFYVYSHIRPSNKREFYIGKGRLRRVHCKNRNPFWKRIVAREGGFDFAFLASNVDEELAFLIEVEAIDAFRRRGYALANLTDGGEGPTGQKFTAESINKMRSAKLGKPLNKEHRKSLSDAMKANHFARTMPSVKGRKHSDDSRAKMSASRRGRVAHNKGKPASPKTVARLAEAQRNRTDFSHSDATKLKLRTAARCRKQKHHD